MLTDPSNAELASAAGSPISPQRMDFDLVIVGAGPAGLSAAVYGASEGFSTLVVDSGGLGGQATSSSLIRNYLGFPRGVSGRRLAQNAYEQAWVFGANFAFMQKATGLRREDDELAIALSESGAARALLLATGARYRLLGIPELEALNGAGVFYGGPTSEAPGMAAVTSTSSAAPTAGQAALHLARYADRVTLVARAESLDAGMSHYLVQEVEATPRLHVRVGTEIVGGGGDGRLDHLVLRDRADGREETVSRRPFPDDRRAPAHRLWRPRSRAGRARLRAHRKRPWRRRLVTRPRPVPARDEHAQVFAAGTCAAPSSAASSVGEVQRDPTAPPPVRGRAPARPPA